LLLREPVWPTWLLPQISPPAEAAAKASLDIAKKAREAVDALEGTVAQSAKKAEEASVAAKEAAELKAMFEKSSVVTKTVSTKKSSS